MRAIRVEIEWHPGLPIFASESFLRAVGDEYGWIGGVDDSGKSRCILPYTIIKKAFFRMVRFRVQTIPLGEDLNSDDEKSFLNSAVDYLRGIDADMIIPATTNTIFRSFPDGAIAAPYGSYIIDLRQPEEKLWSNMHRNNRTAINRAIKNNVKIRNGLEYAEVAYEQVRDTFKRSAIPFMDAKSFRRMLSAAGDNVKIFAADYQGTIQACAVNFYSMHSAYSMYAGGIPRPEEGATKLLHWDAMRFFRSLGVECYDFAGARINPEKGSKQEKLAMYKRELGGQLVEGYIWKYPIRPLKYAVYSLAVRFLRGGDIVDQEKHKLNDKKI